MAVISRVTVWSDGQTLTASAINGEFNNLLNDYNGGITNANISAAAAISTSKISGLPTFPTGTIVGTTDTQTLSAKRITKTVQTASDATSITPSWDTNDITKQTNTQGSGTLTINAPSGTPNDGDLREIAIKSTNSQTYSFNATYKGGTTALPTTHAGSSKTDLFLFQYSSTDSNWKLAGLQQAIA